MALPGWTPEPRPDRSRRLIALAGTLVASAAIIAVVAWLWPARPTSLITKEPALANTVTTKPEPALIASTAPAPVAPSPAPAKSVTRVDLDATAPTWVSLVDDNGTRLLAQLLVPGAPRTFELAKGGTLRAGNAGGLVLRVNGRPSGPLGATGQVREFRIKDGQLLPSPQ